MGQRIILALMLVTILVYIPFIGIAQTQGVSAASQRKQVMGNASQSQFSAPRVITPTQDTIPTTSNPTINNAIGGVRVIANPSFELGTHTAFPCESQFSGWLTSHPLNGGCRVFELWGSGFTNVESLSGVTPPDGLYYIELNAYSVSMAYQPICMVGGETFDFEFYHHTRSWSTTNEIQFRFGIPTGLPSGSRAADSYSRVVAQGVNVLGASGSTATASITAGADTTGAGYEVKAAPNKNWVRYYGTHTIPSDFGGVKNLGFYGILPANSAAANLIDNINIGLKPIVDMGASRDRSASEGSSPTALKIRINGKVAEGMKVVLNLDSGTAVPDTDFTIGTVSAGANGTASVTHTSGSSNWVITVPPGYYDGGINSGNNQDGLTIPVNYIYDQVPEATEWAWFKLGAPNVGGATSDWLAGDPTCDNSQKSDGAVYSITNLEPTATPTLTSTRTSTPTPTNTATRTPAPASGNPMVTINGGGGMNATGSDGIKTTFNMASSGEQLKFAGSNFIYGTGDLGVTLNIGGTPYTVMNGSQASTAMSSVAKFDSLVIGNLTGSANITNGTTTGDGSVIMTYTKTIAGKVYKLERRISYTYPNYYYHDEFNVIIPAGNTAVVKLYKGGDTAPGGSDNAYNMYITNPVKNIQSIEPTSKVVLGMKEIPADTGMSTFEGAYANVYTNPYPTINSGGDIGFSANYGPNDAGFMIQYTIGSTPGTYHEENITYVGFQKVNLEASWSSAVVNDVGRLNLMLTNAFLATKTGLGFNFQLPAGLIPGALGSTCTGATVTVDGSNVVHISGISMTSLSSCLVTVDVGSPSATTYSYTAASASSFATADMANAVGSAPVTFLQASSTFTSTPTATNTATSTATKTLTSTNTAT